MSQSSTQTWTRGQAALRDLIMLSLDRLEDRTLREEGGYISVPLLELCGLGDTETTRGNVNLVLRKLVAEGAVVIDTKDRAKRIYGVTMTVPLPDARRHEIQKMRLDLQKASMPETGELSEIEQLQADCATAYRAILIFTAEERAMANGGYVRMSAAAVLRAVGINSLRGREIRHYLRALRLAQSVEACDDGTSLWWWDVREAELDPNKIKELATSELSYERVKARGGGRKGRKDPYATLNGPVTITHQATTGTATTTDTAAPAPKPGPPPQTVRQPQPDTTDTKLPAVAATVSPAPTVGESVDARMALLAIIARLEAENLALRNENTRLAGRVEELDRAHATCGEIDDLVRDVIARHRTGG